MFNILAITDNKLSSLNQCNSIINELKRISKKKIAVEYMEVYRDFLGYLPNFLIYFFLRIRYFFEPRKKIDFIISCGRISAPFNLVFKKIYFAKNCHILNPYFKRNEFDQIIIPEHDITKKIDKNVITTFGSLVDLKKFEKNKKIYKPLDTPKKKISFFIGGNGKSSKILPKELEGTIKILNFLSKEYEVYYCFSRRTPINIKNMIKQALDTKVLEIWGEGQRKMQYIYIEDVIQTIIDSTLFTPGVYNLGGNDYNSVAETAKIIADATSSKMNFLKSTV